MNLLPPEYKKDLAFEAWRRFLIFFIIYFGVVGMIGVALLLPSYFFLNLQINEIEKSLATLLASPESKKMVEGRARVEEVNRLLEKLITFDTTVPKISPLVEDIFSRVGDGITLTSFSFTPTSAGALGFDITLLGTASRREALFVFASELQKSKYVKSTIEPLTSDLIKEEDLTFTLKFSINPLAS